MLIVLSTPEQDEEIRKYDRQKILDLEQILYEQLLPLKKKYKNLTAVTTLSPGMQQVFTTCCWGKRIRIPYQVVVPFWDYEKGWSSKEISTYKNLAFTAYRFSYLLPVPKDMVEERGEPSIVLSKYINNSLVITSSNNAFPSAREVISIRLL